MKTRARAAAWPLKRRSGYDLSPGSGSQEGLRPGAASIVTPASGTSPDQHSRPPSRDREGKGTPSGTRPFAIMKNLAMTQTSAISKRAGSRQRQIPRRPPPARPPWSTPFTASTTRTVARGKRGVNDHDNFNRSLRSPEWGGMSLRRMVSLSGWLKSTVNDVRLSLPSCRASGSGSPTCATWRTRTSRR